VTGLTAPEGGALLAIANEAIRSHLLGAAGEADLVAEAMASFPRLGQLGASFVTLRSPTGALRGCIGSIEPSRPLALDVAQNAVRAATADPRLPSVAPYELAALEVKVSVLSELVPMEVASYDELERTVRPGTDGLLVESGRHRGTFLPSVWAQVPEPARFLSMLWDKAGLRPGVWPAGLRVWRYQAAEVGPPAPAPPS
jgi:AmmeMemoRadiSam system protein A